MTGKAGPDVITSGLVLHLDALNSKSYSGTTTWYDISDSKAHGTMFGTVPTSADGGGCFDFATVSGASSGAASLGFTFASNMIPTTGSFTLSSWIKNPPAAVGQCGMFSNAGGADGYRFGIGRDACYVLNSGVGGVGYSEPQLGFTSSLTATDWYNVVMIFDRAGTHSSGTAQWRLYLNGVLQTSTNMVASANTAFSSAAPGLVRSACCGLYTGKLATFSAYSLSLSATEVATSFANFRGRFGI
jgi:hypothetical protein